ncbi:hypothetical protein Snov_3167 [Ancylobacter novellus DSM 506]|uniref:Uncharacterized protein n=1 Tax=Ancylobacter novellus (strain ATCC 8093 / DSM 506 / JCM 20403 / CCM 1077 / IAM 12100 / NBRC 12443 / NCIMB 10456) TaxID=639283 RepID=D7A7Y4_ANCN5|nr:hypothetical protein Snov_3167 [Ancylobacter novellus DSM 506]
MSAALAVSTLPAAAVTGGSADSATVATTPQAAPAQATNTTKPKPRQKVSALPGGTSTASGGSSATSANSVAANASSAATGNATPGSSEAIASPTPPPGPYYVDFRARTAASYGHAFIWYGKSSERAVEVAGLHPATDSPVPYVLGHLMWVQSETGASYGDLDEQYLTANYRVYLSEEDAPKVIAYIQKLQKNSPLWNATTTNCTWFIGQIASFMGLKTPWHLLVPEEYVNELKKMNGGRNMARLSPDQ